MTLLYPWFLAGLLLLPLLWRLLKILPPPAKNIRFSSFFLLQHIPPLAHESRTTPLLLRLIRMLLACLLILALSNPIYQPTKPLPIEKGQRLLLLVNNSWQLAAGWQDTLTRLHGLMDKAARQNILVDLLAMVPAAGVQPQFLWKEAQTPENAIKLLESAQNNQGFSLQPFTLNEDEVTQFLQKLPPSTTNPRWGMVAWVGYAPLTEKNTLTPWLQQQAAFMAFSPPPWQSPLLLRPPSLEGEVVRATILRPRSTSSNAATEASQQTSIELVDNQGIVLQKQPLNFANGAQEITLDIKLPAPVLTRLQLLRLSPSVGAGGLYYLSANNRLSYVGIAGETGSQPLLSPLHYLTKALETGAIVARGNIDALLASAVQTIYLPDMGSIAPEDVSKLQAWINKGGVLVRFAGNRVARAMQENITDPLLPAPLHGIRQADGSLGEAELPAFNVFPENSPFQQLPPPADSIKINKQILALPTSDTMIWAALKDGTPIVTARRQQEGLVVFFHVTADPSWSNLPFHGLFPSMLLEIAKLKQGKISSTHSITSSITGQPLWQLMDGWGHLAPWGGAAIIGQPEAILSPLQPPGLYGTAEGNQPLNIGDKINQLEVKSANNWSLVNHQLQEFAGEINLAPYLGLGALLLLILDMLALILLYRGLFRQTVKNSALLFMGCIFFHIAPLSAAPISADKTDNALTLCGHGEALCLGYVETGDSDIDKISALGLEHLGEVLQARTSINNTAVIKVNWHDAPLPLFTLVYWPITEHTSVDAPAMKKLNGWLDKGGMVLMDTRDANAPNQQTRQNLQAISATLDIPPMAMVEYNPQNTPVLAKSFYLLKEFPGRFTGEPLWADVRAASDHDGVSTLLVGSHDWAGAWATSKAGIPLLPTTPGGETQREMALRFGVNLVMYSLTGNYKADQVHVPFILERLK
ncbi:MAG: DUF4159 domain-containing protein [Alphaproteobacteria bacterium]